MKNHTPSSMNNILILGAGELGNAVIREMATMAASHADTHITVMLRSSATAANNSDKKKTIDALQALGVSVLSGDVVADSVDALAAQFNGFDTIVSCVGFSAGAGTQLKLAQAALACGVKRFVPWQFGVDYDTIGKGSPQNLFDEQLDVRALLRAQSSTEWLIISTGMFTSFLFEPSFGVVDLAASVVHALGSWDTAVTVTTPEDIGYLTARILFAQPVLKNQVVFVAGDTLTYAELADTIDAQLGRRVERVSLSPAQLDADLQGAPNDQMKKYRAVFAAGKGVAWEKSETFNARQKIEVTTVIDWIENNLATVAAPVIADA